MTSSASSSTNTSPYVTPDSSPEISRKNAKITKGGDFKQKAHDVIDDAVKQVTPVVQTVVGGSLVCATGVSAEALKARVNQKLPTCTHGMVGKVIDVTQQSCVKAGQKSTDTSIEKGFKVGGTCTKKSTDKVIDTVGNKCLPNTQDSDDEGDGSDGNSSTSESN